MVDDPQQVLRALKRGQRGKQQAVLNVICGTH
jgi:hypothetical protein